MSLERGLQLIREGAYFDAHEELEDEWRDAPAEERDFLQGLVHVAVAWLHAERGNRNGCERQLVKAARRLDAYRPAHRDVPVEAILESVAAARRRVETGSLDLVAPRFWLEGRLEADRLEEAVEIDAQHVEALEEQ